MNSLAERAIAEHEARVEATRLRKLADDVQTQARAKCVIIAAGEKFDLSLGGEELVRDYDAWHVTVKIDDDAHLEFRKEDRKDGVKISVKPAAQLYWNLPPGKEEKLPAEGGTYGCFGLDHRTTDNINSVADLGAVLAKIRAARVQWRKRHCPC